MPEDALWTLDMLFAGRPACRRLYDRLESIIRSLGTVKVKVTKKQVSFADARQFAWVWLPIRETPSRPAGSIVLSFALDEHVVHPHIVEAIEPRPGRWMHHVIIEREVDLDAQVRAWLAEAYAFGQMDRRR